MGGGTQGAPAVSAAYATADGLVWLELPLAAQDPAYPDLSELFLAAGRMQRAAADLSGVRAEGAADTRPWLNHGAWPAGFFPLQHPAADAPGGGPVRDYPFVRVEGDGVHEIAVGPVHAGIIEPGHFRFSVVGEKVLRLEQRLGYTHKGTEQRFTRLAPLEGHRLAGRVCGDSTVAYAWAYCMALESAAACEVPPRARWLRALLLERERVANHLGDLGALGNDAGFAVALAQFSRLREDWLRLSAELFGHRLMMDCVVPGGVACDVDTAAAIRLAAQCEAIGRELQALRVIYEEHAGLQDRFAGAGRVGAELALRLGLNGLAARASGQARDLRCDLTWPPYDTLAVQAATHAGGDVAARVAVRFDEALESLRLIRAIAAGLPAGPVRGELQLRPVAARGAGRVEGWRGEVLVVLELEAPEGQARVRRCHCHDPSWQNWPVLEHAVIGNIVPDFPLINKSFNLSYSGHDL
ncbi:MAG: NADH-quinone oxidoreductase subunit C [Burkholderiales bacterium]|nr:NADH-quinone oxidoreductase subunit C [Burkholderiales bacterium]